MSYLANIMGQVKKLKNGVGVQNLLDQAYKILGNPIAMFNTEYNLLAYTEVITDDSIWNELIAYGTFCVETQKLFEEEGFIEELTNALRSALMKSEKLKYDRMTGKLFNKNNSYVSNLLIVACNKPFEEYDQIVFEAICKLISKEISTSEFYQEYEQTHQETTIKRLIDGNYDSKLDLAQVGIIYDFLDSHLYIAVVDISLCDLEHTNILYFRDLFKKIEPTYKYAIYSDYIVIIISTNDDILNVNKKLHEFIKVFDQNNMYAGISGRFENLFELKKYYMEAVKALQCTLEVKGDQRIFPCNQSSMDKMEQIKKLENGLGIQYFLDQALGIFGNPVFFHDMELNLLGYTHNAEIIDPVLQELITYGTSSDETIELFRSEGMIDIMDNIKGGALLISDKFRYDRISWRIYNNENIRIGCTSIANSDKSFSEDELVLFGAFSQKFSKEVGKIDFYTNYGQVYSNTIINRLLSGKIDDYTFYSENISNLYDNLMENLYLVVINTAQCQSKQINLTCFRDLFNWPNTVNRYAIYSTYIVIIISTNDALSIENTELNRIIKMFEQNNIYAGISSCFENIYELQKYYIDTVNMLNAGIKNKEQNGNQRVFQADK